MLFETFLTLDCLHCISLCSTEKTKHQKKTANIIKRKILLRHLLHFASAKVNKLWFRALLLSSMCLQIRVSLNEQRTLWTSIDSKPFQLSSRENQKLFYDDDLRMPLESRQTYFAFFHLHRILFECSKRSQFSRDYNWTFTLEKFK